MIRIASFTISGEAVYDQHGFCKPGFDPNDITWGRSIYYRDINKGFWQPIGGVGYYVNVGFELNRWTINLNYGDYYPEKIGVPLADIPNHRGLVKADFRIRRGLDAYLASIIENGGYLAQDDRLRRGFALLTGVQYVF